MVLHYKLGLGCIALIFLVIILGILNKLTIMMKARTKLIISIKNLHRFFGLVVMIICKVNSYLMFKKTKQILWIYVAVDVVTFLIWVVRRFYFPKM
jgi:hypothetical protein